MESVDLESIGEASDQDYFPEQFTEKAAKPKKSGLFRRKKKLDHEGKGIHDVVKICNANFQIITARYNIKIICYFHSIFTLAKFYDSQRSQLDLYGSTESLQQLGKEEKKKRSSSSSIFGTYSEVTDVN